MRAAELLGFGLALWRVQRPHHQHGWMMQGEALYRELEASHPPLAALPPAGLPPRALACFETFPHAITWHLRGGHAVARRKRLQRRALLEQAGIGTDRGAPGTALPNLSS